jgi:hypothetical protein
MAEVEQRRKKRKKEEEEEEEEAINRPAKANQPSNTTVNLALL